MNARIAIFRVGTHTAMSGLTREYTREELAACAAAYDPAIYEAPVVVGHPDTDSPAYGWVKRLSLEGDMLYAEIGQIDPAFADAVREGRYKRISAAFYLPESPANPVPGVLYLRHVGFLGGAAPAVRGLPAVSFAAGDYVAMDDGLVIAGFAAQSPNTPQEETAMSDMDLAAYAEAVQERDALKSELAALREEYARFKDEVAARERKARHQEHAAFCATQVADGRLPAGLASVFVAVLDALADIGEVQFAETGKPLTVALREAIASLPRMVDTVEHAAGDAKREMSRDEFERLDPAARMAAVRAGVTII